jgi:hypothetical protein
VPKIDFGFASRFEFNEMPGFPGEIVSKKISLPTGDLSAFPESVIEWVIVTTPTGKFDRGSLSWINW